MILNELSIQGKDISREEMKQKISGFLKVCNLIFREKGDLDFYYTAELLTEELLCGYSIHDWLMDPQVSQKEKAFFRTIINRKQLIAAEDFSESQMIVETGNGETASAVGCLAAYESESYVISMSTSSFWQAEKIEGNYLSLEKGSQKAEIQNCCFEWQIGLLDEKEKNKIRVMVSSGKELWEKRTILYPHLLFCESVHKQLEEAGNSLHIQMIMKRLQILEDYFKDFQGSFHKNDIGYRCREESETVEKNDRLRRMRVFKTPYGKEEFFTWHISFSGNFPGRIHFIPDAEHQIGIVGYIGKHLPTSRFSTI